MVTTSINPNVFSPFFKVKKMILILRISFGLPLKPMNDAFNQFQFNYFFELLRHAFYLCIIIGGFIYTLRVHIIRTGQWNPWVAMAHDVSLIGLTELDLAVLMAFQLANIFSNTCFFFSFKNSNANLNNLVRYLTNLNEEIYNISESMNRTFTTKSKSPYKKLFVTFIISLLAAGLYTSCWSTVLTAASTEYLPKYEHVAFCVVLFVLYVINIYPPSAAAADFVVSHLVYETRDGFDKFKCMIKLRNKACEIDKSRGNSRHLYLGMENHALVVR